jgi:hypothetical protein
MHLQLRTIAIANLEQQLAKLEKQLTKLAAGREKKGDAQPSRAWAADSRSLDG